MTLQLKKAIKHPGALTKAAQQHGVSKLQEAEREEHSSNPHVRARGFLGERLIHGDLHKANVKAKRPKVPARAH